MQLVIFNGSPRGQKGNSALLIRWLKSGIEQNSDVVAETYCINRINEHDSYVGSLKSADMALVVFPLYADGMPGMVMAFLEKLEPLRKSLGNLRLGFVVHSGFPEAIHSRAIEKYLEWLTKELGAQYAGTVVMGGSEGLRYSSPKSTAAKEVLFMQLGEGLVKEGHFPTQLIKQAAGMEKFPPAVCLLLKLLAKTSMFQTMWVSELKKNNAYHEHAAKPYTDK